MGNVRSGRKFTEPLEDSAWLRNVVRQYQERRNGVSHFNTFIIENALYRPGFQIYKVCVVITNSKNEHNDLHWIVKYAVDSEETMDKLNYEVTVYSSLLAEIERYLKVKKNSRIRFVLNLPGLIYHERRHVSPTESLKGLKDVERNRVLLVVEDICKTKGCFPLSEDRVAAGLNFSQFKVFLNMMAQFHAVGISWSGSFHDRLRALESYSFLYRKKDSEPFDSQMRSELFDRYERLLSICRKRPEFLLAEMPRRIELFAELRRLSDQLLKVDPREDMNSSWGGLCLGVPMFEELVYQYDKNSLAPTCATVTTCHRIHFGHIIRELVVCFYMLPLPRIRRHYFIVMLQGYCQALGITLDILSDSQQREALKFSFHKFMTLFYEFVPYAILKVVLAHMKRTDPQELDNELPLLNNNGEHKSNPGYVPLTLKRVKFLIGLLDLVPKNV